MINFGHQKGKKMKNSKLFILIFILFSTKNVLTVIRKIELVNEEGLIEFYYSTTFSELKTPVLETGPEALKYIAAVLDHNLKLEYFQFDSDDLLVFEKMLTQHKSRMNTEALAITWYCTNYPLEAIEQSEAEDAEPFLNVVEQISSEAKSERKESYFCAIS